MRDSATSTLGTSVWHLRRVRRDPLAFLPERKGSVVAQREKVAPKRTGSGG